jgi:hypothetical protein
MWKECHKKEKSQESTNGSQLPLDQYEDLKSDGKMTYERICRQGGWRTGRRVCWIGTVGRQLLSGPRLTMSCSVD